MDKNNTLFFKIFSLVIQKDQLLFWLFFKCQISNIDLINNLYIIPLRAFA